ncbi:insulinase family protein, partial [Escherichia coli]|nr:insulinase family protein [Escherichia coli]
EPFGGLDATILGDMYPADHPYHHSVIGDEADLDAVTVEGARGWFDTYYGPSNVTLILAGDIGGDEARALVAKYFGGLAPRLPVDRL